MKHKKLLMWLFVLLTALMIYMVFHSIPLLYAYIIYPPICTLGLMIAGLIGREFTVGKVILRAIVGSFSIFLLIVGVTAGVLGLGVIYWAAALFPPLFSSLLIIGFIIAIFIRNK